MMWADLSLWARVLFFSEWAIRLVMLAVVPFRRTPAAAKGWLLLIFFEPWIGLVLYLLIGRARLPRWRRQQVAQLPQAMAPVRARLANHPNVFHPEVGPALAPAVTLAENLGQMPILGGMRLSSWSITTPQSPAWSRTSTAPSVQDRLAKITLVARTIPMSRKVSTAMQKVNLCEKFARFTEQWKPKIVGELNGQQVKLVKFQGPFIWHHHNNEDEFFLVVKGRFRMEFRDHHVWLEEGEFLIVPHGVEHRPVAEEEAHVLLFEPASTLNTGNVKNDRTVADLERI